MKTIDVLDTIWDSGKVSRTVREKFYCKSLKRVEEMVVMGNKKINLISGIVLSCVRGGKPSPALISILEGFGEEYDNASPPVAAMLASVSAYFKGNYYLAFDFLSTAAGCAAEEGVINQERGEFLWRCARDTENHRQAEELIRMLEEEE